jgi:transcriptional regulator with XRE-family HTH domain
VPRTTLKLDHIVGALQRLRTERDLSQEKLAEVSDVDRTTVGKIERKKQSPTLLTVDHLLVAMDVTWAEFGAALDHERTGVSGSRGAGRARLRPGPSKR